MITLLVSQVVLPVLFVFVLSCWITTYLASFSSRPDFLDHPNERSLHEIPTPHTGGLAILISFYSGLLLSLTANIVILKSQALFLKNEVEGFPSLIFWILGTALIIGAVSFWDDRVGVSPVIRIIIHGFGAVVMTLIVGLKANKTATPFLENISLEWIGIPLMILSIIWMTNLYNFMDGMDGFAGGMTLIGFGFIGGLSFLEGHWLLMFCSFLLAAAAAGFLVHNIPPAKIFMGDTGSASLGFLAAVLGWIGIYERVFDVWTPILIFSPFIVDATVTLFQRLWRGEKIWQAHRQHYYQRLVLAGWGHRKTVLLEYTLMLGCGISAVMYHQSSGVAGVVILLVWVGIYGMLGYTVRAIEKRREATLYTQTNQVYEAIPKEMRRG